MNKTKLKLTCVAAAMVFAASAQRQPNPLRSALAPLELRTDNEVRDQRRLNHVTDSQSATGGKSADFAHRYVASYVAATAAIPGGDAVIPVVVDGDGVRTRIAFTNVDSQTAQLTFTFGDGYGGGARFQVAGLGLTNTVEAAIVPKGAYEIVTSGVGSGNVGWALFVATGGRLVAQTTIEQQDPNGVWQSSTTAAANFFANRVSLRFDDRRGWGTQIVVVNCNPYAAAIVSMTVRDSSGKAVYTSQYRMDSLNMGVVNGLRDVLGSADTSGTIEFAVASASHGGIAVLGVHNNDSGAFETVAPQMVSDWLN